MNTRKWTVLGVALVVASLSLFAVRAAEKPAKPEKKADLKKAVTVEEARRRAKLLHTAYTATLDAMHRYYFKEGEITVPSRALEDVFYRVAIREKIKANWISVNAQAMSIDHKPEGEFEKLAARALRGGKEEYEQVIDGEYRRAGAVTLFADCINCHRSNARSPVAALVLRVPVVEK